jgi:DNA-binding winged helix-turn-helix (wHTH) protein
MRSEVDLGARERAVLAVLVERPGRVIDRAELRHNAGLDDLSVRRCDSLLVGLRRALGPDAIVTVRRRGWMLRRDAIGPAMAVISSMSG